MKFLFFIKKEANFYYFLHNLSECEWPWPARKDADLGWKKEFGDFTKKEKEALNNFKKIYLKYFLKVYLGKHFFLEKNAWQKLEKEIHKEDVAALRNIFWVFEKKFNILIKKQLPFLKKWKKNLTSKFDKIKNSSALKSLTQSIESLFQTSSPNQVKIFLLFAKNKLISSDDYASGAGGERGRGLDGKSILIEFSKCPLNKIDYVSGIIWHEILHCFYVSSGFRSLLFEIFSKNSKAVSAIEEVIIRSFFPIGVLSMKFFNAPFPTTLTPSHRDLLPEINSQQTLKILKISKEYLEKNKNLDIVFIEKVTKILRQNKRWAILLKAKNK